MPDERDIPGLALMRGQDPEQAHRLIEHVARLRRGGEAEKWAREALPSLINARQPDRVLSILVELVLSICQADDVWAATWSGDLARRELRFGALASGDRAAVPAPTDISRGILVDVLAMGHPFWTDDVSLDAQYGHRPSVRAGGARSVGCIPVGDGAFLYLRDRAGPARLTPDVQARIEALARLAGPFLVRETAPEPPVAAIEGLVGSSRPMLELHAAIRAFGPMPWPALILGESGTGKEAVARAMHQHSGRSREPFIAVNCALYEPSRAESDLFGHEKGSFTGAIASRAGVFERVGSGTLFLDEVGELAPPVQAMLLRVLRTGRFTRMGGDRELEFRGRIVAATLRPIDRGGEGEIFRRDLYSRLAGAEIRVPPLRARRGDIPELARHLLIRLSIEADYRHIQLGSAAIASLVARDWIPDNVAGLENTLKSALGRAKADDDWEIRLEHLDEPRVQSVEVAHERLDAATEALQRQMIREALRASGDNKREAATRLGVTPQWINTLLRRWGGEP